MIRSAKYIIVDLIEKSEIGKKEEKKKRGKRRRLV